MVCPDRSLNASATSAASKPQNYPAALGTRLQGYGYNDGWISDSGYGLTSQQPDGTPARRTLHCRHYRRPPIAWLSAIPTIRPATRLRWTTSSAAATAPPLPARSPHDEPELRLCGWTRQNHQNAGRPVRGFGLTARPASETNALKWCYDPNASSDYAALRRRQRLSDFSPPTESCQQAVHEYYSGSWTETP